LPWLANYSTLTHFPARYFPHLVLLTVNSQPASWRLFSFHQVVPSTGKLSSSLLSIKRRLQSCFACSALSSSHNQQHELRFPPLAHLYSEDHLAASIITIYLSHLVQLGSDQYRFYRGLSLPLSSPTLLSDSLATFRDEALLFSNFPHYLPSIPNYHFIIVPRLSEAASLVYSPSWSASRTAILDHHLLDANFASYLPTGQKRLQLSEVY
jgi:hypothetical protein